MIGDRLLEGKNISFKYNKEKDLILEDINISLKKGEIIGIVGLSGSGKSTLIQILKGIIPKRTEGCLEGRIFLKGEDIKDKDIPELATEIGIVFQDPDNQIVFSCVEDELAFGPENLCINKEEILNRIKKTLKTLNIEKLRYANPNKLSGGEKQLIVMASVLTLDVDILLLDESMSQIDEKGRKLIKKSIVNLKNEGKGILMVEHNLENLDIADKIYLLKDSKLLDYEGYSS